MHMVTVAPFHLLMVIQNVTQGNKPVRQNHVALSVTSGWLPEQPTKDAEAVNLLTALDFVVQVSGSHLDIKFRRK